MQEQGIAIALLDISRKASRVSVQNVIPAAANAMGLHRIIALPADLTRRLHQRMNANAMLDFSMILDFLSVYHAIQTV